MLHFPYSFGNILFLLFAYLCGSIPFGLFISRYVGHTDIRRHGSGNIGATNVARVLGKKWAVVTFLLDGLKGFIPVMMANVMYRRYLGDVFVVLAAISAVLGHIYPVWLRFKGGKGVSTTIFVLYAVDWRLALFFCLIWFNVFLLTRISALSALSAIISTTLLATFYSSFPIMMMCAFLCIIITIRHKENLKRMWSGKEFGFRKSKED